MPCHEAMLDQAPPSLHGVPTPLHLCCVLSQNVATPLSAPVLPIPVAARVTLAPPAGVPLAGLAPPIPVRPPRVL